MMSFASRSGKAEEGLFWLGLRPKPRVREGKTRNARDGENQKHVAFPSGPRPEDSAKQGRRPLPPLRVAPC